MFLHRHVLINDDLESKFWAEEVNQAGKLHVPFDLYSDQAWEKKWLP
jgi:hypothetical protein